MSFALDTNAYSDWLKTGAWAEVIESGKALHMPLTVYAELRYGFACGTREQENIRLLNRHLETKLITVREHSQETAHYYAILRNQLRIQGTPIPTNDIWIAASCLEHDATLLTSDAHFKQLPQVKVQQP